MTLTIQKLLLEEAKSSKEMEGIFPSLLVFPITRKTKENPQQETGYRIRIRKTEKDLRFFFEDDTGLGIRLPPDIAKNAKTLHDIPSAFYHLFVSESEFWKDISSSVRTSPQQEERFHLLFTQEDKEWVIWLGTQKVGKLVVGLSFAKWKPISRIYPQFNSYLEDNRDLPDGLGNSFSVEVKTDYADPRTMDEAAQELRGIIDTVDFRECLYKHAATCSKEAAMWAECIQESNQVLS